VQVTLAGVLHPVDVVGAAVGGYLLYQFIQYEVKSDFMLIGPRQSGKTMAMLGMVLEVLESDEVYPEPNRRLQEGIDRANDPPPGQTWPYDANDDPIKARFQMLVGDLFPRRMRLLSWDFPGHLLSELPDAVERRAGQRRSWLPVSSGSADGFDAQTDGGADAVPMADEEEAIETVADSVYDADILLIVVDCRRFVLSQSDRLDRETVDLDPDLGVNYYKRIVEAADIDETILVATKADVLFHEGYGDVRRPEEMGGYEAFSRQVNAELGDRHQVQVLQRAVGQQEIVPVYFETEREGDEFVPVRDSDSRNMRTEGFDHLLDRLREVA